MARRRRSIFSQIRSVSRNFKTIVSSMVGMGVLGTVGYFSWPGLGFLGTEPSTGEDEAAKIVVELEEKSDRQIKIGTFNIENFGPKKLGNPEVMATLAHIAMGVDVLAIQEISNRGGNPLHELVNKMNEKHPRRFDYLVSPLLGANLQENPRGDTEQFGFIYDTTRIELVDQKNFGFVVSAKKFRNKYNRLPVVSSFKVVNTLAEQPFTFSLVTFHNVPDRHDRWKAETAEISSVYEEVRSVLRQEDDIILLGDFNADYKKILSSMNRLNQDFATAITIENTNVSQTKSYDNLVFDPNNTLEFVEGSVFDFSEVCRKYELELDAVSDHFPVIGSFGVEENKKSTRVASKSSF